MPLLTTSSGPMVLQINLDSIQGSNMAKIVTTAKIMTEPHVTSDATSSHFPSYGDIPLLL